MKQIKSHWKLAYKTFIKAVKVTISTMLQIIRAKFYIIKNDERLLRQRHQLLKNYQEYVDRNFG